MLIRDTLSAVSQIAQEIGAEIEKHDNQTVEASQEDASNGNQPQSNLPGFMQFVGGTLASARNMFFGAKKPVATTVKPETVSQSEPSVIIEAEKIESGTAVITQPVLIIDPNQDNRQSIVNPPVAPIQQRPAVKLAKQDWKKPTKSTGKSVRDSIKETTGKKISKSKKVGPTLERKYEVVANRKSGG